MSAAFPRRFTNHPYRRFLVTYLRPQRRGVALLSILLLGSIALQLANPQVVRSFIDTAQAHRSSAALTTAGILFLAISLTQRAVALAGLRR